MKSNRAACFRWCLLAAVLSIAGTAAAADAASLDSIQFGSASSEQQHHFISDHSAVIRGGLDQPARQLLPLNPISYNGGSVWFDLKVDPQAQNYITVKLWGSDHGAESGRLILFANGFQVGYRDQGDYDVLNQSDEAAEFPGRFLYQTLPLPPALTRGKTNLTLKIASIGPMWAYGANFSQYQKDLTVPTRGIYGVFSQTDPRITLDAAEVQGVIPTPAVRPAPGEEVIEQSRTVVIQRLDKLLKSSPAKASSEQKARAARMLLMSEAFNTPWTPAYHNDRAIDWIVADGDSMARDFLNDPKYAGKDWPAAGPLGEAILKTWPAIGSRLNDSVEGMTRRTAWSKTLRLSVDFWRTHRRDYTNQSMIVDRNIYTANRGLQLIDPSNALPEAKCINYLYQAVGLLPWLGSDIPDGGEATTVADASSAGHNKPFGEHYYLVTRKGLSRELGYVGTYGETILHFMHDIVQLTGDEKIRQQLAKIEAARMAFRYPGVDGDGFRCMKLASEIDNRTAHYPLAGSAYTAPNIREEWWMDIPALLSDNSIAVGAAQQSMEDNQYFSYVKGRLSDPDTQGMMRNVDEYAKFKSLPASAYRLPMTEGQPDFVFSDEEDAVVALKQGDTRLFINFYYRSERGVNGVVRLQELTPTIDRIATVKSDFEVEPTGHTVTRQDWIDGARNGGFPPPGEKLHQAWAGEQMPIAPRPSYARLPKDGDWGPFLGKAAFYRLQWGPYLIGLNTTETRTYELKPQAGFDHAVDLVTGKTISLPTQVGPLTTVVLFKGK